MTRQRFIEIVRALNDIQEQDVPRLGHIRWRYFRADPIGYLTRTDDVDTQAIWDALQDHLKQ